MYSTDERLQEQSAQEAQSESIRRSYDHADSPDQPTSVEAARRLIDAVIHESMAEAEETYSDRTIIREVAYGRAFGRLTAMLAFAAEDNRWVHSWMINQHESIRDGQS